MRANPYKWMQQSHEHRRYAQQNYPVIAGIAGASNGYEAFATRVQRLPQGHRETYISEWNDWYNRFGDSWERLGCIKETRLGQYTSRYRWVKSDRAITPGRRIRGRS